MVCVISILSFRSLSFRSLSFRSLSFRSLSFRSLSRHRQINEKYICIYCIFYWKQNHCSLYSLYLILKSQHYFFFFVIQRYQFAICIQYSNCCVFLWEYWSVSQKLISILKETNLCGILYMYICFLLMYVWIQYSCLINVFFR